MPCPWPVRVRSRDRTPRRYASVEYSRGSAFSNRSGICEAIQTHLGLTQANSQTLKHIYTGSMTGRHKSPRNVSVLYRVCAMAIERRCTARHAARRAAPPFSPLIFAVVAPPGVRDSRCQWALVSCFWVPLFFLYWSYMYLSSNQGQDHSITRARVAIKR